MDKWNIVQTVQELLGLLCDNWDRFEHGEELDETGGNVTMTNVPIMGGTVADIHVKHEGSPGISWCSIELDLGNGDPYRATGNTPLDAARLVWWELCKESEVFAN